MDILMIAGDNEEMVAVEIKNLYNGKRMCLDKVADELGMSRTTLYKKMVKLGIERRSRKEAINREGCRRGGINAYLSGKGIHQFNSEEKSEFGKIGGSRSASFRNEIPWAKSSFSYIYSEKEYALKLSREKEYQYQTNLNNGRPIWGLIAERLNEVYHGGKEIRTAKKVRSMMNNMKYRANGRRKKYGKS
jgi:hypothetical protein